MARENQREKMQNLMNSFPVMMSSDSDDGLSSSPKLLSLSLISSSSCLSVHRGGRGEVWLSPPVLPSFRAPVKLVMGSDS